MYLTPYEIYRKLTVKDSIPAVHVKRISDTLDTSAQDQRQSAGKTLPQRSDLFF